MPIGVVVKEYFENYCNGNACDNDPFYQDNYSEKRIAYISYWSNAVFFIMDCYDCDSWK